MSSRGGAPELELNRTKFLVYAFLHILNVALDLLQLMSIWTLTL